jgi:predicted nucleic acid-binding protein
VIKYKFRKGTKICLDTMIFIYFFEEDENYFECVYEIFKMIEEGKLKACTSVVSFLEIMVGVYKSGEDETKYIKALQTLPNFEIIDLNQEISIISAKIRAKYKFKVPDSILLATSITSNCDVFLTNDEELKKFKGEVKVLTLSDLC